MRGRSHTMKVVILSQVERTLRDHQAALDTLPTGSPSRPAAYARVAATRTHLQALQREDVGAWRFELFRKRECTRWLEE